jgi:hypothetical protein
MTPKRIVYFLCFLVVIIAFNNCSGGFTAIDVVDIASTSSQCREKIVQKAASLAVAPELCENPINYQCDLRHFRPGVGSETSQAVYCVNVAGMGEACIPVNIFNYDTSAQQKDAEAAQMVEGGSYNRDEVSCVNTQVTTRGISMIQAEGNTVSSTLETAIDSCRQRSRQ